MGKAINCATGHCREANKAQDGNTCVKKVFDLPTTISISLSSFHNADKRALQHNGKLAPNVGSVMVIVLALRMPTS